MFAVWIFPGYIFFRTDYFFPFSSFHILQNMGFVFNSRLISRFIYFDSARICARQVHKRTIKEVLDAKSSKSGRVLTNVSFER